MDQKKRKELLEQYKQQKTDMGVIRITNTINGKVFVGGYPNLKGQWETIQTWLSAGTFSSGQLQREWKEFGPEAFTYEVLEQKDTGAVSDPRWELTQMKKRWMEKLGPYGDRGYHKAP